MRGLWECEERSLIRPLVRLLAEDPSANVRTAAAMALGRFAALAQEGKIIAKDSERVRDGLRAAINRPSEDMDVRRRAIEAVSHFDQEDIKEIIRQAHKSGDSRLRQSAIYALGKNASLEWLPVILAAMDSPDAGRYGTRRRQRQGTWRKSPPRPTWPGSSKTRTRRCMWPPSWRWGRLAAR